MQDHSQTEPNTAHATATAAVAVVGHLPDNDHVFDVVVVGGGPSGATAARDLARSGHDVALLDRAGRIKPCGGAIPPRLIRDFDIPDELLVAKARSARIIAPSEKTVDMPIEGGFVGLVDREHFDEWLRTRAADAGATRVTGTFKRFDRDADGTATLTYLPAGISQDSPQPPATLKARYVIAADGARSKVAKSAMPDVGEPQCVFAYHEIIASPAAVPSEHDGTAGTARPGEDGTSDGVTPHYDPTRCDVFYQGRLSPDFYAWVFPHGRTASIGVGSANKGFSLRSAVRTLRRETGLEGAKTVRREGAPIPMKPLARWDNRRDVILAGDAAGVVAPASGEGIYYAMLGGQLAGDAVALALKTGDAAALATARKAFMKDHGRVFWALGLLQWFWYCNDKRRERFVSMCADPDVQRLTWQAYMNKELVRSDPWAHLRVMWKDVQHLLGMVSPWRSGEARNGGSPVEPGTPAGPRAASS